MTTEHVSAPVTMANDLPIIPESTLIRSFGLPSGNSSDSVSSCSSGNNNSSSSNGKGGSSNKCKDVLGCGGKKDYGHRKRIVVDFTWRRGKVYDKVNREYQRF